jgi:hypothetical protein
MALRVWHVCTVLRETKQRRKKAVRRGSISAAVLQPISSNSGAQRITNGMFPALSSHWTTYNFRPKSNMAAVIKGNDHVMLLLYVLHKMFILY